MKRDSVVFSIDGFFLTQLSTGTQRYALEILKELDKLCEECFVEIVVPEWSDAVNPYSNISMVKHGQIKGKMWEQISFCNYIKKNDRIGIFLNNVITLFYPKGIVAIHDVSYKANPIFFKSVRDKISMLWHRLHYYIVAKSKMEIITVSEFSKSEISKYYHVNQDRIHVIHSAWQHINRIKESSSAIEKFHIEPGEYYFTLSTLGANKNFKWILYAAHNNPTSKFIVAGGGKLKGVAEAAGYTALSNIQFLGYLTDSEIKSLMKHCKAFLFPTLYEGFGLTPLEAIASGARSVIVSDTECMHEIYGESVSYINPVDYDYEISYIERCDPSILQRYSWKSSASLLFSLMEYLRV